MTKEQTKDKIQKFADLARELARKAGPDGITGANVYHAGVKRGWIEHGQKELRWMSNVFRKSGLVKSGALRPSDLPWAHRRPQTVWVLPEFSPQRVAQAAQPQRAVDLIAEMRRLGWAVIDTPGRFGGTQYTATYEARTARDELR